MNYPKNLPLGILLIICTILHFSLNSQTIVVLQPTADVAKDAEVWNLEPDQNYGDWSEVKANAWTWSGVEGFQRALFEFDLTSIPEDATIISAYLSLYAVPDGNTQYHSGDNECWIQRITEPWDEYTVTWNDQPVTTTVNQLALSQSIDPYQDYLDMNVTALVQDMISNPTTSFGFLFKLNIEDKYRRMSFLSSDQLDITRNPKLVIEYNVPVADECLILQPDSETGVDAELWNLEATTNFGDWPELKANAWTWGGTEGKQRALVQFDLTSLPEGAIIDSARLSLYGVESPSDQYHFGMNISVIRRVTSSWDESTVTWSTQPAATMLNQVILPVSTSPYQDYLDIDVTTLVSDMIADPMNSYGFQFRLGKEKKYRRMTFASSDYANSDRHPKLEICYHVDQGKLASENTELLTYPNPFSQELVIKLKNYLINEDLQIKIYDLSGRLLFSENIQFTGDNYKISTTKLQSGTYIISIIGNNLNISQTVIKL